MNLSRPITLRQRILLTLLPLLVLIAVLGTAGVLLLHRLGGSIDVILRENYESVVAMEELKESIGRIDSSFQLVLAARGLPERRDRAALEEKARLTFAAHWQGAEAAIKKEMANVTIHPDEDELAAKLSELAGHYHNQGQRFFERAAQGLVGHQDYYGPGALSETVARIGRVADDIAQLNQREMVAASSEATGIASRSIWWLSAGSAAAVLLAGIFAWHTVRTILSPLQSMTHAAIGISAGNLDQVIPPGARDELGQLAEAFNRMARHLRDIRQSHMAQLLRAQRTSQASIDSFPDPILVVDTTGAVEMANPAARRVLGVLAEKSDHPPAGRASEKVGRGAALRWHPPETLRAPLLAALQAQEPYLPEGFDHAVPFRLDDQEHFFLPRILPVRDPYGNTLGAAVLLQDVTRFRLLDEIKTNLVATVSHELKTPLTSVRLAIHLLLEENVGPLTPKQIELLLDARQNAELLVARVENLLDLTRLERGREQLDIRPERPMDLLTAAADAIRPKAEDKGLEVQIEADTDLPNVPVDGVRFGLALGNLLENAVAYTDRGGHIRLSAVAGENAVTFQVADTGIGIAPEFVSHVFDRFFRVPGQNQERGTGLGLAIAREIVTAHGGTIACESCPGAGTIFRLTLPMEADGNGAAGRPASH